MKGKKLWSLVLAGALLASGLSGCGTQAGKEGEQKQSGDNQAGGGEILIGTNFEMTGNAASYGQGSVKNIRLAIEEINAAGGVLGKKIRLVEGDNKSEPSESANVTTKLITQDKVVAIIGPAASSNAIAAAPICDQFGIPLVPSSATASGVTVDKDGKTHPYVFRTCMINPFQGKVGAAFAIDTLKAKTAVIVVDNSTDYSKDLAAEFEKNFIEKGGKILGKEAYLAKDTDFRAILTKIKQMNPDIIYLPGYYNESALFIKQARELGLNLPIVGGDAWDSPTLVEVAGAKALNNTFFTNHYSIESQNELSKKYVEAYQKKYGELPDAIGAMAYDAAYLVADAIKRAGSADPKAIRDALEATKDFKGISGTITFDDKHNPIKSAFIIEFVDGKQKLKTIVEP
ncbi:MAG: ABC transporter substrate-binding protein [Bacillota bacterium]|uniref:Amino acid/amide ABC transporter substrate-binding protein, HAAT family (TC 3.A.1.4.-) n=2 Tax=Carboxydocella TaxID=178898 RepID=A0A1T4M2K2_9FIRM|nr:MULTISPECIES: ABC transporter substrate-binding protein [Carboxydocella]AVX21070.1 branched-chain amino acid transport system substrate-binding protein [Carboxydocella thermautotrophica]AVX31490.1 branched-chain amino acid transport system substrate-binding protein [Carboxydocella thermautotrophica]SJZ61229.1 amino acid/amide ABC transporter substrate-binding protein, HAAT family (TC 3.A.1.4.-) [Carboxydocella sporoproducens DSM 16521]GAW28826.1 ethanolamine utilization protein EutJ [Carboxy